MGAAIRQCTFQHPTEAEVTLADWQLMLKAALRRVEERQRADDLADMEPEEAGMSLMLALTVPEWERQNVFP